MIRQSAETVLRKWLSRSPYSQSDLAEMIGISRSAVSKWCLGGVYPSPRNAVKLEKISGGGVPASIWPRRTFKRGDTPGALAIWAAAAQRDTSILGLALDCGIPQRSMARWAAGEYPPRASGIRAINKKLGLSLTVADFEVRA